MNIDILFENSELIPTIIVDANGGKVLMLAFMNAESLTLSMKTGYTCFYSPIRKKLWKKGESTGHVQRIISIHTDCDNDTLLIAVEQTGAVCHTGKSTCFFKRII